MKIGRFPSLILLGIIISLLLLPLFSIPLFAEEKPAAPAGEQAGVAPEASAEAKKAEAPKGMAAPKLKASDYPTVGKISNRVIVWIVAQLHLYFAAFVLAVPIFVLIIEGIGIATKDERYDHMAHEFIKVSMTAFSITSIFGGILAFALVSLYPDFFKYLATIFGKAMIIYAILFFGESFTLYVYYYGWDRLNEGFKKWVHLTLGLMLNAFGMTLMVLSNAWSTFMMAPSGLNEEGLWMGSTWAAIKGYLWNPLNLHRFIANIAFGGAVVGAYAAYRLLTAKNEKEKAHYDWMGYTANFIALIGLLPLPFAGYYLMAEVYAYSQQMGITAMGGAFAWLFIMQAVLIGTLFLGANYYLWIGMGRIKGAERYRGAIKYLVSVLTLCFLVWFTPHTLIMTASEVKKMGGVYHPILGVLGVMSAKNTAVNTMIITTFISFLLYKRSNKIPKVSWVTQGNAAIAAIITVAVTNIVLLGIYGYYLPANIRIGLSIPQVFSTLSTMILCTIIDMRMYRKAESTGPIEWGKMPARSQYVLILLAIAFTWLMGLMGFIRSGLRLHYHVNGIMRDYSVDAFTPTLAYAANVVNITVLLFLALNAFIFWLAEFSAKKEEVHAHSGEKVSVKMAKASR